MRFHNRKADGGKQCELNGSILTGKGYRQIDAGQTKATAWHHRRDNHILIIDGVPVADDVKSFVSGVRPRAKVYNGSG